MDKQMQQQIVGLVQAAMSGDQKAAQQIQLIEQAAKGGDQQAMQLLQVIQLVAQLMLGQAAPAARKGAALNYIKRLRNQCPEGEEMQYFKVGGKVCGKCMKKKMAAAKKADGGKVDDRPEVIKAFEAYRCGGKAKVKKAQNGDDADWKKEDKKWYIKASKKNSDGSTRVEEQVKTDVPHANRSYTITLKGDTINKVEGKNWKQEAEYNKASKAVNKQNCGGKAKLSKRK